MGTKLEYVVHPLETSGDSHAFKLHGVADCDTIENREPKQNEERIKLCKFQDFMDRLLEKNTIEYIKKTMQMHEDIFKQQVKELHRLYSVQRMLVNDVKKEGSLLPATRANARPSLVVQNRTHDTSSRGWSSSPSADTFKMPRAVDLERPAEEDLATRCSATDEDKAGPSFIMKSTNFKMNIDASDEDCGLELTLSIGGSQGKKNSKRCQTLHTKELKFCASTHDGITKFDKSTMRKSEPAADCRDSAATISGSSSTFDQQRFSLHRT